MKLYQMPTITLLDHCTKSYQILISVGGGERVCVWGSACVFERERDIRSEERCENKSNLDLASLSLQSKLVYN